MITVRVLISLMASAGLIFAASSPVHEKSITEKLREYRTWKLITPQAVDMSPAISASCKGPSIADMSPNPHAPKMFKVYVNSVGFVAMKSEGKVAYPVGSMIVKEKYARPGSFALSKDAKPELLTAMVKYKAGFDPKNGDWEYFVLSGDAKKVSTDGLEHCAKCHLAQKDKTFVFGDYGSIQHGRSRFTSPGK